jgi:hypothetical protein
MNPVTIDDRRKELKILLQQMQDQPSRDWTEQRARVTVLNQMIAAGSVQASQEEASQQRG